MLGPLHYLTEISWLHQKQYYIPNNKKRLWVFPLIAALLTLMLIANDWGSSLGIKVPEELKSKGANIIFFLFAISFVVTMLKKTWQKVAGIVAIILLSLSINLSSSCITCTNIQGVEKSICDQNDKGKERFIQLNGIDKNGDGLISLNSADNCKTQNKFPAMLLLFGAYIPTLIHVYFFTMFFMLFGALKSKSKYGYAAVVTLIICGIIPFVIDLPMFNYQVSSGVKNIYDKTFFPLNQTLFHTFQLGTPDETGVYTSRMGIMLTRFIAFAYTYHYLNWFSKTSIIQWHKVPVTNLIIVLALWGISIGLYAYNYIIGFTALLFLSFMHVFVEFPLNFQSFVGIYRSIAGKKIQPV